MAKRVKAGELDESLIIQTFKDTELLADPADAIAVKPEAEQPPASGESAGEAEIPANDTAPKGKSRRRRGSYDDIFLKPKEIKTRQPVYVSLEIHQRITKLVHMLAIADKEISVGGYIDNVLADHLEQHKEEIDELKRKMNDF